MKTSFRFAPLCLLLLLPGQVRAQSYQSSGQRPSFFHRNAPKSAANPAGSAILSEGTVFWVELPKPFLLASAKAGQSLEVDVLLVNPRKQVSRQPIGGNAAPSLPSGCKLRGSILKISETKTPQGLQRRAVVLFNELIGADGKVRAFLGGLSNTDDDMLPRWQEQRKFDGKDRKSAAESMAVVLPWAADLGPIGIAAAVFGSRFYYQHKLKREELEAATEMAISWIDGDLVPETNDKGIEEKPRFFIISTLPTNY